MLRIKKVEIAFKIFLFPDKITSSKSYMNLICPHVIPVHKIEWRSCLMTNKEEGIRFHSSFKTDNFNYKMQFIVIAISKIQPSKFQSL